MARQVLAIKRIDIDEVSWWPVTLTVDCACWWFRCDDKSIKIRTDPADATTEDTAQATVQYFIPMFPRHGAIASMRFRAGDIVCYVQTTGNFPGQEQVILTQVRA